MSRIVIQVAVCLCMFCSSLRAEEAAVSKVAEHRVAENSRQPTPPYQQVVTSPEPDGRRPLVVNPPTFRWGVFGTPPYVVTLSRKADMADSTALGRVADHFLRPPAPLPAGRYFWQVKDARGRARPIASFKITDDVPRWPIPPWEEVLAKVPTGHPRIYMRPEGLPSLRELAKGPAKSVLTGLERWAESEMVKSVPDSAQLQPLEAGLSEREAFARKTQAAVLADTVNDSMEGLCILYLLTDKPKSLRINGS